MAYGHAERTLAAISRLEAETMSLLSRQECLDAEQAQWLRDAVQSASLRRQSAGPAPRTDAPRRARAAG